MGLPRTTSSRRENLVYFVTCDAFTDEVLGESYICSPLKVLNKIKNREGIIFSDLNLNKLDNLKKLYRLETK